MPSIIELEKDSDGVYKPSKVEKKEIFENKEKDKLNQFLDGAEKGVEAINRIVNIFSKVIRGK